MSSQVYWCYCNAVVIQNPSVLYYEIKTSTNVRCRCALGQNVH